MKNKNKIPLIVICILDGWGIAPLSEGNAISQADTNNFDKLIADYPVCTLKASGSSIGLSKNQAGNCEIGHYCLGTSRKWPMNTVNNASSTLCGCLRQAGYKLSYLSDSEKIAYITYFLNGGVDQLVEEAEIIISPSPRVDNYKEAPELALAGLYKYAKKAIKQRAQNAIIANFSNLDLVARTGSLTASIKSTEIIDGMIGDLAGLVSDKKGILAIVADHGNAEAMIDPATGAINDATTDNPVPFIIAGQEFLGRNIGWQDVAGNDLSVLKPIGSLLDFTPTILDLLDINKPAVMEGKNLINKK
ncbi:hypothetical protein KAJ89_01680 [Candidatus Parcubacteria bacterium]|nr:hypothetical protein [Candidatus Parcubacteria bacterium]